MTRKSRNTAQKSDTKFNKKSNNWNAEDQNTQQSAEMKAAEDEEENLKKKVYELSPEWKILSIAKRKFLGLPSELQDSRAKSACVDHALSEHKKIMPDAQRFWMWMVDEKKKMLRVWDFAEVCRSIGRDVDAVAENLLFEGKAASQAVRLEGLEQFGSKAAMFRERLFVDKFKLFEPADSTNNPANE